MSCAVPPLPAGSSAEVSEVSHSAGTPALCVLPGSRPSSLVMSTEHCCSTLLSPETLPPLWWFKQWVRKGRRRCKTLIFVTNDYLQNTVLLQPYLTSKYIQHTVMLPSWLKGELEVKLTGNTSNLTFLIAPTLFRRWSLYRKGNGS